MSIADVIVKNSGPANPLRIELLEQFQADIEPAWGQVAELLRKTFNGDHCVVTLQYGPGVHETLATAGLTDEWEMKYEERFATLNPFITEAIRRKPAGSTEAIISTADQLVPSAELKKLPFYREFWAPLGINDSVGILLFEGQRPLGHISIRRKSAALRYGEAEEARLRSITDILHSALARSLQLRILEARAAAFERLNVDGGGGLIVLDERGAILEAEGIGRAVVEHYSSEFLTAAAAFRSDSARSRGTIGGSRGVPAAQTAVLVANANMNSAADITNMNGDKQPPKGPFSYEFRRSAIEGRARTLCILQEKHNGRSEAVTVPSDVHFTPRERDVLQLLGRGLDNLSIAKTLNIGLYTTKDHVKSIFRKLGVKTRAEAVAVLARGASPSGCMWS